MGIWLSLCLYFLLRSVLGELAALVAYERVLSTLPLGSFRPLTFRKSYTLVSTPFTSTFYSTRTSCLEYDSGFLWEHIFIFCLIASRELCILLMKGTQIPECLKNMCLRIQVSWDVMLCHWLSVSACSFEVSENTNPAAQCHIPGDLDLQIDALWKSQILQVLVLLLSSFDRHLLLQQQIGHKSCPVL